MTQVASADRVCPGCGNLAEQHRFCPHCGLQLSDIEREFSAAAGPFADPPVADPARRSPRRKKMVLVAGVAVGLAVAGSALLLLTDVLGGDGKSTTQAKLEALHARLLPPFTKAMRSRDALFLAERRYLAGMHHATAQLRKYRRNLAATVAERKRINERFAPQFDACARYADVSCPDPTYPNDPAAPDLGDDVTQLRGASSRLDSLHADVLSVTPPSELKVFYAQLSNAAETMKDDATYNADTITQAVTPPDPRDESGDSAGNVEEAKIKTLHQENALPAIEQMNRAAVSLIRLLGLPLASYDVPGGHDLDPDDHSSAG
jgi:hypothetical protein